MSTHVVSTANGGVPPTVVCNYVATASLTVVRSGFTAHLPLSEHTRNALLTHPGYAAWPSKTLTAAGVALNELSDEVLLLSRIKLVLDYGANVDGESSRELSQAIDDHWPHMASLKRGAAANGKGNPYAHSEITADVDVDGNPSWGFTMNVAAGEPLPLNMVGERGKRPEFDRFLQNLARADVQRRIEALL